jgi:hypothetical protein
MNNKERGMLSNSSKTIRVYPGLNEPTAPILKRQEMKGI